jgi:septum formation protein
VVSRFRVVPSTVDEERFRDRDPVVFALQAAAGKAKSVGEECPSSLIIAADTLVCLGEEIFGKPKNYDDARAMLQKLSGERHRVVTAVVLYRKDIGRMISDHETSWVTFKKLSRKEIEDYLGTKSNGLDKAGSYAIQESGDALVRSLEGDYDNVVGLPVRLLSKLFKDFMGGDGPV